MISQSELKNILNYDPESGVFSWVERKNGVRKSLLAGYICRTMSGKSYRRIAISGKLYSEHRLAFLYMQGAFPIDQVDHINGNGEDNRWCNLREVSRVDNQKNKRLYSTNTYGHVGVYPTASKKRWRALITTNKKTFYLGVFDTIDEAINARRLAEIKHEFHENHGTQRML